MKLYFVLSEVPRTTTRAEWYEAWRETRLLTKELALHEESRVQTLMDPTLPKHIREDMIYDLIYPRLALGPLMP